MDWYWLIPVFFIVAMFYSSAGFGGGSSYLAFLALASLPFTSIRVVALTCNIIVVVYSSIRFHKLEWLNLKKAIPFVVFSVPMAFLMARWEIEEAFFYRTLSVVLVLTGVFLFINIGDMTKKMTNHSNGINYIIGGAIGALSGLLGIGGGIFLAPVLYFIKWDKAKVIAATCSFFILVNSISGILGQFSRVNVVIDPSMLLVLGVSVLIGSIMGVKINMNYLKPSNLKRITGVLVLLVGLRIFVKYWL